MRYLTPLRYPGGKARLANNIKRILEVNNLVDGHYVEVYAGGAGVACSLLIDEYVSHVHINDYDRSVYSFWSSVLNNTESLCRKIRDTRVTVAQWRKQRAVQANQSKADELELGFSTFFLNRTNRSGIICSGGVIGGNDQTGEWKIDARYNKSELIERIQRIARYRDRITLYRSDAAELLHCLLPKLPKKTLLYLDPPYYVKGKRRLYANFYEHADHEKISKVIQTAKLPWIVSYDDQPEIRLLYANRRCLAYGLQYSARDRYNGAEVMFFSPGLKTPMDVVLSRDGLNGK
ncbi:MAG TPA: DNA adenine methylase [Archangium sp.]|uniref:DNA adenine methylase n=1 Tax=Archangium sp. TaxID=1872627 RepID=UPI002EDB633A